MPVRTTVVIPDDLHRELRKRAAKAGTSMRALIIEALEEKYGKQQKGTYVTGPMIKRKGGKLGPLFPTDEDPHDLVFS
jgi:hypothetical protein